MREWFGTDGIRGVANRHPVTVEIASALGRALGRLANRDHSGAPVLIGRDTRRSGPMLEAAVAAGAAAEGVDVLRAGVLPTPGVAALVPQQSASFGVVISASHNPYRDNGLKIFGSDGFKLPDDAEAAIEREMKAALAERPTEGPEAGWVGDAHGDAVERYVASVLATLPEGFELTGLRVVLDCANGAAHETAPAALRALGADVHVVAGTPDGRNINVECGATRPRMLQETVLARTADVGIALDGDADRAILVDERGQLVDGDRQMAICALDGIRNGTLPENTLVATVMSNLGLELAIQAAGGRLLRTAVGDRYVVEAMRAGGYGLGGEQSGHLIFLDRATTGDGLVAALSVLEVMRRQAGPLSTVADVMEQLPQTLLNVRVGERKPLDELPEVVEATAEVERELAGRGRVLLRYSGTEPLARVMIEGPDQADIERSAETIAAAIRRALPLDDGGSQA